MPKWFIDRTRLAMTSMFVPEPVMSLAITPKKSKKGGGSDTADKFSKVSIVQILACFFQAAHGSAVL